MSWLAANRRRAVQPIMREEMQIVRDMSSDRVTPVWLLLLLLWVSSNSLRVTVLAVPPLLPTIHRALHLDETLVGALTALPVLLLAAAAIPGSLLVARVGSRRALVTGILAVAVGGALRGVGGSIPVLFAMTLVMGAGVAVSQPALPSLVRQWLPERIALATATYSNGMLMGEVLAASLTATILLSRLGGSWQAALAVWSLLAVLSAAGILGLTPHVTRSPEALQARWFPNWRDPLLWRLGIILGCASLAYFAANAFIPDFLKAGKHGDLVNAALTSINLGQLPASFIIAARPGLFVGRIWPFLAAGGAIVFTPIAFVVSPLSIVLWAGLLGFFSASVLVVTLALVPSIVEMHDIHRLTAGMFTISYTCPFAGSLVGGAVWDLTGHAYLAFTPIVLAGLVMAVLARGMHLDARQEAISVV